MAVLLLIELVMSWGRKRTTHEPLFLNPDVSHATPTQMPRASKEGLHLPDLGWAQFLPTERCLEQLGRLCAEAVYRVSKSNHANMG